MRLAIRCARDSMPPLRLAIIDHLATHPFTSTTDVRRGIDKPRTTVDRQLQALHMLEVATCSEVDGRTTWLYSLAGWVDPDAITVPDP